MSVTSGWLDWAIRFPGIADKVYAEPNAGLGIVCHSIEGIDRIDHVPDRFLSLERDPADPSRYSASAAASVMFINPLEGPLIQMYPVTASTWTSGNRRANTSLWAVESEGFAGTPLNSNQVANMLRLCADFEAHTGRVPSREPSVRTIWQHNEVWDWSVPNAGPTACPSGRYQPFFDALIAQKEAEMQEKDVRMIVDQALGVAFLPLLRQVLGVDPSTFSDVESVQEVRGYFARLAGGEALSAAAAAEVGRALQRAGEALAARLEQLGLALAMTLAIPVGGALMTLDESSLDHPLAWVRSLIIGCAVALGTGIYRWGRTRKGRTATG
jgi:hypothetical protein